MAVQLFGLFQLSQISKIKLTLALADIADSIIFAKNILATFCCLSYPNHVGPLVLGDHGNSVGKLINIISLAKTNNPRILNP